MTLVANYKADEEATANTHSFKVGDIVRRRNNGLFVREDGVSVLLERIKAIEGDTIFLSNGSYQARFLCDVIPAAHALPANPVDPHAPGAKLDDGKQRPFLVLSSFADAIGEVVEVGTYGSVTYSDRGWLSVPNGPDRYMEAATRHILAHWKGEEMDPESGLRHLAHATWNLLAILQLTEGVSHDYE